MEKPSHVYTVNGGPPNVLHAINKTYEETIQHIIGLMDGSSRWAYCLWRVTDDLDHLNPKTWSAGQEEYIQCAGSVDAMTVELRFLDGQGEAHQVVLGRELPMPEGEATKSITWDDGRYSTRVYENEVFTADEAAKLFFDYFSNDSQITGPYFGREIAL